MKMKVDLSSMHKKDHAGLFVKHETLLVGKKVKHIVFRMTEEVKVSRNKTCKLRYRSKLIHCAVCSAGSNILNRAYY